VSVELDPAFRQLLQSFGLRPRQKRLVYDALLENADGLEDCALRAQAIGNRNGNPGTGLLLTMIRDGEHLRTFDPNARRITGWRFVRGTHSGSYVRDKLGTDLLPEGHQV